MVQDISRLAHAARLENRVALITGAASGIGRGIALAMADEGACVVVNHFGTEKAAREVAEEIRARKTRAVIIEADVSREDQVQAMFARAIAEFGAIDILVSNAGIQRDAPFDEMTLDKWRQVIDVNLTGAFLCAREAVRAFKRQGPSKETRIAGNIIFISSVHEVIPWSNHVNYAAAKGGIKLLMKSLAQEVAADRIRVNSIAPGAIKTDINRAAWQTPEARSALRELIPWNRIGDTRDIGSVAVWLASDESDYVHGITLFVDGGMTLYPGFATGG